MFNTEGVCTFQRTNAALFFRSNGNSGNSSVDFFVEEVELRECSSFKVRILKFRDAKSEFAIITKYSNHPFSGANC